MGIHNFWHNFSHGFMHGMFNNSPFWGCWGGIGPMWGNPFMFGGFCNSSIFLTPSVMNTGFYPLMPAMSPPSFNFNINMNELFPTNNVWDNLAKQNAKLSYSDIFVKATSDNTENIEQKNEEMEKKEAKTERQKEIKENNVGTGDEKNVKKTSLATASSGASTSAALVSSPDVKKTANTLKAGLKDYTFKESNNKTGKYDDLIVKYAKLNNIDADLVRALIKQESSYNPNAKSYAGAIGLMQLMPATAQGLGVTDPYNPEQNIMGGTKYLKQMLDKFNGNVELALAAYNAGPNNKAIKQGKIPQNGQTPHYVSKVLEYYKEYKEIA